MIVTTSSRTARYRGRPARGQLDTGGDTGRGLKSSKHGRIATRLGRDHVKSQLVRSGPEYDHITTNYFHLTEMFWTKTWCTCAGRLVGEDNISEEYLCIIREKVIFLFGNIQRLSEVHVSKGVRRKRHCLCKRFIVS